MKPRPPCRAVIIDVIGGEELLFSQNYACEDCGISIEELTPRMFSFNNPYGACPECTGLGAMLKIDPDRVIPDPGLSIREGAVFANGWHYNEKNMMARIFFDAISREYGVPLDVPVRELPKEQLDLFLYGTNGRKLKLERPSEHGGGYWNSAFEGVIPNLERRYRETGTTRRRLLRGVYEPIHARLQRQL